MRVSHLDAAESARRRGTSRRLPRQGSADDGRPLAGKPRMQSTRLSEAVLALVLLSCGACSAPSQPVIRWLKPSEMAPQGRAPGAKARLLTTQSDGTKTYVLVLSQGDQVQAAIAAFANDQHVVDAHFSAIGAVRDPEVAWFDPSRKEYKALSQHEQMEGLTLS